MKKIIIVLLICSYNVMFTVFVNNQSANTMKCQYIASKDGWKSFFDQLPKEKIPGLVEVSGIGGEIKQEYATLWTGYYWQTTFAPLWYLYQDHVIKSKKVLGDLASSKELAEIKSKGTYKGLSFPGVNCNAKPFPIVYDTKEIVLEGRVDPKTVLQFYTWPGAVAKIGVDAPVSVVDDLESFLEIYAATDKKNRWIASLQSLLKKKPVLTSQKQHLSVSEDGVLKKTKSSKSLEVDKKVKDAAIHVEHSDYGLERGVVRAIYNDSKETYQLKTVAGDVIAILKPGLNHLALYGAEYKNSYVVGTPVAARGTVSTKSFRIYFINGKQLQTMVSSSKKTNQPLEKSALKLNEIHHRHDFIAVSSSDIKRIQAVDVSVIHNPYLLYLSLGETKNSELLPSIQGIKKLKRFLLPPLFPEIMKTDTDKGYSYMINQCNYIASRVHYSHAFGIPHAGKAFDQFTIDEDSLFGIKKAEMYPVVQSNDDKKIKRGAFLNKSYVSLLFNALGAQLDILTLDNAKKDGAKSLEKFEQPVKKSQPAVTFVNRGQLMLSKVRRAVIQQVIVTSVGADGKQVGKKFSENLVGKTSFTVPIPSDKKVSLKVWAMIWIENNMGSYWDEVSFDQANALAPSVKDGETFALKIINKGKGLSITKA